MENQEMTLHQRLAAMHVAAADSSTGIIAVRADEIRWLREQVDELIQPVPAAPDPLTSFPEAIETLRHAFVVMTAHEGDLAELLNAGMESGVGEPLMTAEIFGQFLMQGLDSLDGGFSLEAKLFWTRVCGYIGPDYIGHLRKAAAFMDKVDGFN